MELEDMVGGKQEFEPFLKAYIANFQYQSITTDQFIDYLKQYFQNTPAAAKLAEIDWNSWLHTPGMPSLIPKYYILLSFNFFN